MNALIKLATTALEGFLSAHLPKLTSDWWQKHVIDRLSFQQQRHVQERGCTSLRDLDFAALLRVLDQNWFELSSALSLPKEARNWVKELQTVRNKWAHQSAQDVPPSEMYRDADTLERVLTILGTTREVLSLVEATKTAALTHLASHTHSQPTNAAAASAQEQAMQKTDAAPSHTAEAHRSTSLFAVGDLVGLRSNPTVVMPVIEVLEAITGERRYRVFQNNAKTTYYESQI